MKVIEMDSRPGGSARQVHHKHIGKQTSSYFWLQ